MRRNAATSQRQSGQKPGPETDVGGFFPVLVAAPVDVGLVVGTGVGPVGLLV